MAAQPNTPYTPEQYLQLERSGAAKHEYLDGRIYALAGASRNHNRIAAHILGILYGQLRHGPCEVYPSDMRVKVVATGLHTYPDISVVCGQPEFADAEADTLLNPLVIFEILSPSTERFDRGKKFEHYRRIPTLQEYILVSQDKHLVEQYVRQDESVWLLMVHSAAEHTLTLRAADARLTLADVYEGIVFERV